MILFVDGPPTDEFLKNALSALQENGWARGDGHTDALIKVMGKKFSYCYYKMAYCAYSCAYSRLLVKYLLARSRNLL